MKKYLIIAFMLFSLGLMAQDKKYKVTDSDYKNDKVEMADTMRSSGKIYVVVGVIFILFIGITFYLYNIDKKLTALEKELEDTIE